MVVMRIERAIDAMLKSTVGEDVTVQKFAHDEDEPFMELKWQLTSLMKVG